MSNPRLKEKYDKEKSLELRKNHSKAVSGKNNPMYGRSVKDIWIEKYGKEEANKMWENRYKNDS